MNVCASVFFERFTVKTVSVSLSTIVRFVFALNMTKKTKFYIFSYISCFLLCNTWTQLLCLRRVTVAYQDAFVHKMCIFLIIIRKYIHCLPVITFLRFNYSMWKRKSFTYAFLNGVYRHPSILLILQVNITLKEQLAPGSCTQFG